MTYTYDSEAERGAALTIAQLGGVPCQSFLPHLPDSYQDADGAAIGGKPDFRIDRERCFTFVDTKDGVLHSHYTFASSDDAQKDAYRRHFHRSGDHLTHWDRSKALFYDTRNRRGKALSLETGWNHQLWKLAALQALHGWQRFLVVFKSPPKEIDALRYIAAGLVFCTVATLPDMMLTIELSQHGFLVPFLFKTTKYAFTVMPDPASRGLSSDAIEASDRTKFLAAIETDKAGRAEALAQAAADWDAGLRPF
jgi:hypothetical protein